MCGLQKSLKEMFPIESGDIDKKDRIIPELPGMGYPAPLVYKSILYTNSVPSQS